MTKSANFFIFHSRRTVLFKIKICSIKKKFFKLQIGILYKIISGLINIPSSEIPTIFIWLNSGKMNANNIIIGMSMRARTYNTIFLPKWILYKLLHSIYHLKEHEQLAMFTYTYISTLTPTYSIFTHSLLFFLFLP